MTTRAGERGGIGFTATRRVACVAAPGVGPYAYVGGLKFDSTGALVTVGNNGIAPAAVANNWPLDVQDTALPAHASQAGFARANGVTQDIYCTTIVAIDSWTQGVPFGATEALCIGFGPPV
jgi:hypothetical protein